MSRAFTKEDDAGEDLPERPVPSGPNYVTPRGMSLLKKWGEELVSRRKKVAAENGDLRPIDRDLRYLEARISTATMVPTGSGAEIRFGALVTIQNETGARRAFQIVGEDEARTDDDAFIPWSGPLSMAVFGSKAGDIVTWDTPNGPQTLKIISVDFTVSTEK